MSVNVNKQLSVLLDLLSEHSEECCGSVSECKQINRLVQSMIAKNSINDQQLAQLLPDIYNYSRQGEMVQDLDDHITSNQTNLKSWVNVIENVH